MDKKTRITGLLLIDAILITLSIYLAFLMIFDFGISNKYFGDIFIVSLFYIIIGLTAFSSLRLYRRIWQYASIGDLLAILKGAAISGIAVFVIHNILVELLHVPMNVPRSIHLLAMINIFLLVGGSRFAWRMVRDNYIKPTKHLQKHALIVGAGEAGVIVAKELRQSVSHYSPIGFIDDNEQKQGAHVRGVPVLGNRSQIAKIVKEYQVEMIVIAMPSEPRKVIAELANICKKTKCQIKVFPSVNDVINGKLNTQSIRDVSVEDLLGRDPVQVDLESIAGYLSDEVVLVTGAGGSIGSEISRQVANMHPKRLLLLDNSENNAYEIELELRKTHPNVNIVPVIADVQNKERINWIFEQYRPAIVFHAAAHKHVPMMEQNPGEAVKNNVFGTKNVAEMADKYGAKRFILISTDKAVNPTSVMGTTKRVAEMVIQQLNEQSNTLYSAVRFGNVLGSRGSVIPLFKKQIAAGGPVTVTHPEMIRYFMTIPEACMLVIQAGAMTSGGELFILDMGEPVKIADLASDLIRLSGLDPDVDIPIVYSGMRPGEKLYEELLTAEEGSAATKNDRIYIGASSHIEAAWLEDKLDFLRSRTTASEIRHALYALVPSFSGVNDQTGEITVLGAKQQIEEARTEVATAVSGGVATAPSKAQLQKALDVMAKVDHKAIGKFSGTAG